MRDLHIAIDLGSTTGRIVVGNLQGLEVVYRFLSKRETILGTHYWDIIGIFSEIKIGLTKAFSLYGNRIASIGIDTWGVDYGLLDDHGLLVSPVFHYRDTRTNGMIEEVATFIDKDTLYGETGIALLSFNTLYQLYAHKKEHPEVFKVAKHFLDVPDILAYFLTGVMKNERTHASTTAMFNPVKKDWNWKAIDVLGFPRCLFGEIIPSGTILGPLDHVLAEEIGAPQDILVVACATHDTASAVSWIKEDAFISSGTWSLMGMNLDLPVLSHEAMINEFTNEVGADGRITFLQNIMGMWISNECIRSWGIEPNWKVLDEEAEVCSGYCGSIDPTNRIFMAPSSPFSPMDTRVKTYLLEHGFPAPKCHGEFLVAIYRGLAKVYANNVLLLEKLTGKKLETIRIVGGGSRNKLLNELTARETGKKIYTGPTEATSLGNMLYQCYACGDISTIEEGIKQISGQRISL